MNLVYYDEKTQGASGTKVTILEGNDEYATQVFIDNREIIYVEKCNVTPIKTTHNSTIFEVNIVLHTYDVTSIPFKLSEGV